MSQPDYLKSSETGFDEARRQFTAELVSGVSGFLLALFMCGHVLLVGSILTGVRGFDWVAVKLEEYFIAQPTVVVIFVLFLVHAAFAARKIPARLRERRKMLTLAKGLWRPVYEAAEGHAKSPLNSFHLDSRLWIWQVRTGLIILILGGFHIILIGIDVLTPLLASVLVLRRRQRWRENVLVCGCCTAC